MKLALRRDGVEIAQTFVGGTLNAEGLYLSPVGADWADWSLTVGADSELTLPGVYDLVEIEEIELEETDMDRRAKMPTLSPVQFRKMLRGQGITAAMVEAAIAGIAEEDLRADASDAWEYATFFERLNPLIDMIGALLGLTPEQIDAAWLGAVDA